MITAYSVPWRVDRSSAPHHYRLINVGDEPLDGLRISLLGAGIMLPVSALRVRPHGSVTVSVRGRNLPQTAVLVVRWFRPNGDEYLWRVSF